MNASYRQCVYHAIVLFLLKASLILRLLTTNQAITPKV
jgi:hypothetical protein